MPTLFGMGSLQWSQVAAGARGRGRYGVPDTVMHGGVVAGKAFPRKRDRVAASRQVMELVAGKAFHS